jgi:hypothetical protein
MISGKWYWEYTQGSSGTNQTYGILSSTAALSAFGGGTGGYCVLPKLSRFYANGSFSTYGSSLASGDILGVAFDADTGTLTFYKNGSSLGTASSSIPSGTYLPSVGNAGAGTSTATANFGQRAFAYTAPSGYKALCTANLPEPTIADGSKYFDTKLYTGNGSTKTITGIDFSPDFVWIKDRASAIGHAIYDSVRGPLKGLCSNSTTAELVSIAGRDLTGFTSDGFTLGNTYHLGTNTNGNAHVAWAWDAGTSTVTNNDGSIASQVRANPSAGFSIVKWNNGGGGVQNVGHGLNATPEFWIFKPIDTSGSWFVYHKSIGTGKYLRLERTDAQVGTLTYWTPTATAMNIATNLVVGTSSNMIAYCFAPVEGYSAMGSYTGNGSADGPFVFTGFRPAFLMIKATTTNTSWYMLDEKRDGYNTIVPALIANGSNAESSVNPTGGKLDFLSNGFKLRASSGLNESGNTYIYAAFASNPFQANGGLAR